MRFFGITSPKNKTHTATAVLSLLSTFASAPLVAFAASPLSVTEVGNASGLATTDLATFVGRIIYAFLGLLGIVAVVLTIYAGFLWMTAQGNDEKIKQAKRILTNAVVGLVIIMASTAIVTFVLNAIGGAITGGSIISTDGGTGGTRANTLAASNRGSDQLGNGIIEYHFPEPGQTGVARNTKISITFKKPLVLSSVFRNYDDKGTYDVADDTVNGSPVTPNTEMQLNTDNIRLIANASLADAGSGTVDAQFSNRYPISAAVEANARVTVVTMPAMKLGEGQTLVIRPTAPIGSPSADVNYRVALRGGDTGVRVWSRPSSGGTETAGAAFARPYNDGGYFWTFTTNTLIDTTPPRIVAVEPYVTNPPGAPASTVLPRNQLLQIYFSEPIDPTTSTGNIGGAGGFANLEVQALCQPGTYNAGGASNPASCVFNNGQSGTVQGTMVIGNRNMTLEFAPTAACENVSANSCGEAVNCLPKNVRLTVRALAATIGDGGPAAIADNGITDMAGNSLDGNNDGTAQGPQGPTQPGGRVLDYYRNNPPTAAELSTVSDTARWEYLVGSNVDLVAPYIVAMDPPPPPDFTTSYPNGPSNVPPLLNPSITWSKTMSISTMKTGGFNELQGSYNPDTATLFLRSRECAKTNPNQVCTPPAKCDCTRMDPPGFFIDAGQPIIENGTAYTKTSFMHPMRPFFTANDLGYTAEEINNYPENVPQYVPIARAQIRDTRQNCFWPSKFVQCTTNAAGQTSCCNRSASPDSGFLTNCSP